MGGKLFTYAHHLTFMSGTSSWPPKRTLGRQRRFEGCFLFLLSFKPIKEPTVQGLPTVKWKDFESADRLTELGKSSSLPTDSPSVGSLRVYRQTDLPVEKAPHRQLTVDMDEVSLATKR